MKELKSEDYYWGLNLNGIVGMTMQSALIEIKDWTPKVQERH